MLAKAISIDKELLLAIENNEKQPSPEIAASLSNVLELDSLLGSVSLMHMHELSMQDESLDVKHAFGQLTQALFESLFVLREAKENDLDASRNRYKQN